MSISSYASDLSAASPSHSCEFTQSNPSPQSGMVQPVVNDMFATVHAAGSSLLGLFTSLRLAAHDEDGPHQLLAHVEGEAQAAPPAPGHLFVAGALRARIEVRRDLLRERDHEHHDHDVGQVASLLVGAPLLVDLSLLEHEGGRARRPSE
eukprot:scaffold9840_cov139-Isochrysis_galbana.AAC.3